MSAIEPTFSAVDIDSVTPLEIGEGCYRRDLPSRNGVRIWIVDMEPGAEWPHVDLHDQSGEDVFVFSGELIEGERRLGAGSFLAFSPFSKHRPRTETGVRLFGINLLPGS
jgi:hypothetical protein